MRAPRTRFAAPFVAVVAAGCSAGTGAREPQQDWKLTAGSGSGDCYAEIQVCPRCNPPAPIAMACPAGVKTDGSAHIVSFDGKTCSLDGAPIACPTYSAPPPPPPPPPPSIDAAAAPVAITRAWDIFRDAHGSGCQYFVDGCATMQRTPGEPIPPCNPPPSKPIACPAYLDANVSGLEVVQHADGTCAIQQSGTAVPCPP